jgi:deoxyribodipyrimidine photolyase-related protein
MAGKSSDAPSRREHGLSELTVQGPVGRLLVLFGDQLDARTPALKGLDRERDAVLLMEVEEESRHVPSSKQRTALFLSAMRHFALELHRGGLRVQYVRLEDPENTQTLGSELDRQVSRLAPRSVSFVQPGEWRVQRVVESFADRSSVEVERQEDPHFLCTTEEFAAWATGRKALVMEHFYRRQRKRLGLLLTEDGEPLGGRWNFDQDNREPFRDRPRLRAPYRPRPDGVTLETLRVVKEVLPDLPGELDDLRWPVTRKQARRALADFVEHRLPSFGTYQDAMWSEEPFLFHSLLSSSLNLKLLDPREVVAAAVRSHEAGLAPIHAVEGFVRQVIGWREFVRGVYWTQGEHYAAGNGLDQHGELPEFYWTADTDMECVRESVAPVLAHGYSHHVQRLMITGNLALIAGVHPRQVSDWYLGMFVDGVDWVTLPNALGMVMHADGGVVGTKPYAASGKYVNRMSNYCGSCPHDPNRRTGDGACPLNALYWDFLLRQRERLRGNRRMAMILANVDRLAPAERTAIQARARELRVAFKVETP